MENTLKENFRQSCMSPKTEEIALRYFEYQQYKKSLYNEKNEIDKKIQAINEKMNIICSIIERKISS
jgi:hypothetical protein